MKCHRTKQTPRTDLTARVSISRLSRVAAIALLVGFTYEASAQSIDFDIDAQQTDDTLLELAETAGIQIAFATDRASKSKSPPIMGPHSIEEALSEALQGTGLDYQFANADFVVVTEDDVRGVQAGSVRAASAVLTSQLAQLQVAASQAATSAERSRRSDEVGTSVITGKVTDARTGANLKGAKVTIEETGQWTSTDDLGEFRFVNVSMGHTTLTVSYLGYAGQSTVVDVRAPSVSQSFALRGGVEIEEVVVFGQRSARAIALNRQRTAQNNATIVSSDHLGQFSSTNLPDALRRVPGVSFVQDLTTGQPEDVAVRGLTRDLNSVQLNGITVPGDGTARFADISNVLTDSIESVTISKSLLPSQETNGTGGLIEIETKTPLDRPDNFYQFGYERAEGVNDTVTTNYYTATLSRKFLDSKNLGFSISAQYADDELQGRSFGGNPIFGTYLPEGISSSSQIDPRLPFPFVGGSDEILLAGYSAQSSAVEQDTLNLTVSAAYEPSTTTSIRADYNFVESESLSTSSEVTFSSGVLFGERPVAALDGAVRNAAEWTGFFSQTRQLGLTPTDSTTHSLSLRADKKVGNWEFNTTVGFSERDFDANGGFSANFSHDNSAPDPSLFAPEIVDPIEGVILAPHEQQFGIPLFSSAGMAEYADDNRLNFSGGSFDVGEGKDTRFHFEADVRFVEPLPFVNYVAIGIDIEDSDLEGFNDSQNILGTSTLGAAGVARPFDAFLGRGAHGGFAIASASGAVTYRDFIRDNSSDGGLFTVSDFIRDPLNRETSTNELNIDYYFETSLMWRDFELIGGVRVATTDVEAAIASSPSILGPGFVPITDAEERLRGVSAQEASQTDVLPRVLINYRPNENFVARAGYSQTASRPPLGFVGGFTDITLILVPIFGDGTQNLGFFFASNPDLEPATTDNFDIGAEYYFDNGGIVKASLFYKAIDNLQETLTIGNADVSTLSLPDDPIFNDILTNPDDYQVTVFLPQNNESTSTVWGAEFEYEQQFTALPGAYSGLGVFGNIVYVESEKDDTFSFQGEEIRVTNVPFDTQPEYSGSVGVTYNRGAIDASVGYTFQGRTFSQRGDFGLDQHSSSFDTLDLRIEYFGDSNFGDWRVFVEGTDLLRGEDESNLDVEFGGDNGVSTIDFPGGTFFRGRTIRLGVLATF